LPFSRSLPAPRVAGPALGQGSRAGAAGRRAPPSPCRRGPPSRRQVLRAPRGCGEARLGQCRRRAALAVHPDKVGPQGHCAAQRVNHVSAPRPRPDRPPASSAGGVGRLPAPPAPTPLADADAAPLWRYPRAFKRPFGPPTLSLPTPHRRSHPAPPPPGVRGADGAARRVRRSSVAPRRGRGRRRGRPGGRGDAGRLPAQRRRGTIRRALVGAWRGCWVRLRFVRVCDAASVL
jgi:hypothetical protein